MARSMLALATRRIPSAAAARESFRGSAMRSTAAAARAESIGMAPPRSEWMRPRTTCASVTVAVVPLP